MLPLSLYSFVYIDVYSAIWFEKQNFSKDLYFTCDACDTIEANSGDG